MNCLTQNRSTPLSDSLNNTCSRHSAKPGQVLFCSGGQSPNSKASEQYTPALDIWTSLACTPDANYGGYFRDFGSAAIPGDQVLQLTLLFACPRDLALMEHCGSQVFLFGYRDQQNQAALYSFPADTWTSGIRMPTARSHHTAATTPFLPVLVLGGIEFNPVAPPSLMNQGASAKSEACACMHAWGKALPAFLPAFPTN